MGMLQHEPEEIFLQKIRQISQIQRLQDSFHPVLQGIFVDKLLLSCSSNAAVAGVICFCAFQHHLTIFLPISIQQPLVQPIQETALLYCRAAQQITATDIHLPDIVKIRSACAINNGGLIVGGLNVIQIGAGRAQADPVTFGIQRLERTNISAAALTA